MATPQIERKPETHFENLCNNPLTISTRHGICSDSWNVTVERVAHRIWKWEKRDARRKKRDRKIFLFFSFFLFFYFNLTAPRLSMDLVPIFLVAQCAGGGWGWRARVKVESRACYKIIKKYNDIIS